MIARFILILSLFYTTSLFAQEPYKVSLSIKDGLPSHTIYSSFQDKEGFMWFSSDRGILKYDGYKFLIFDTEDGLADNENFNFFQDSKGRLWFYSYNGKLSYYLNKKFYNEKNNKYLRQTKDLGLIIQVFESKNGEVQITYRNGTVCVLNFKNKNKLISFKNNPIYFTLQNGNYFTQKGIYNSLGNRITAFDNDKNISNFYIRNIKHHTKNYFAFSNKVYAIENNQITKLFELDIKSNEIISLFIDSTSVLWIGTRNGVFLKNILNHNSKPSTYFKENSISSVNEDFEKNIWITTLDNGIFFLPNKNTFVLNDKNNLKLNINCLTKDPNNSIWAGSNNDEYYKVDKNVLTTFKAISKLQPKNSISQIYPYKNKIFVIGNHAIQIKENNKNKTIQFLGGRSFLEDNKGNYWFGASYLFKLNQNSFENLNNFGLLSTNPLVKLPNKTTKLIQYKNQIWAGTNKGVFCIENDKINNLTAKFPETKTEISSLYFQESTRNLIAGTTSKGIFVFQNNKLIKNITKKAGLTSNIIYAIKKGFTNNSILVCHNFGLDLISWTKNEVTIKNLNSNFGLERTKVNDVEIVNDSLYIASDNGLLIVNYKNIVPNFIKPKVILEDFIVKNKNYSTKNNLVFKHNENDFIISFIGLSYNSQKNISYLYKLKGHDEKWTKSKSQEINYKALSPGKYEFIVQSVNSNSIYSDPKTIPFSISKPFWKTYPFIIFILGSLFFATYILLKKREKSIREKFDLERKQIQTERDKANLEKQMIELEQKALRMQMNPHFIFNALNTIKGYYSEGNYDKAGSYISKFSVLLRMLLEKTEKSIPLSTEIKMLKLYIELTQIRYKNIFSYEISIDPAINPDDVAIPTLLLQPIVENAIIHGLAPKNDSGILSIRFEKQKNALLCIVKDDGIGMAASLEKQKFKQHNSKTFSITKERLEILENEFEVKIFLKIIDLHNEKGEANGTEVIIQIPYKTIW
ncbi:sensor histidine kinase [Flavobacterium sp.]|uniref:sensor histidine kinase n=1 Tax=Flavobacterium sp. TaxID=239 RepID=UPI00374DE52C